VAVLLAAAMAGLLIAACGGSDKSGGGCVGGSMKMSDGSVMCDSAMHDAGSGGSGHASNTTGTHTAGMNVRSGNSTTVPEVNGVAPVATQTLATRYWQGMEIQAQTRTPVRFIQFAGNQAQVVNPPKGASFHLMVMLSDAHTGEPMPYSGSVWATITNSAGHRVYDAQQWPMISAYMGPHYGDNVSRLASGRYQLTILIGTPISARTREYKNVWLKPHTVTMSFRWSAKTATATVIRSGKSAGSTGPMSGMSGMAIHTNVAVNGVKATPSRVLGTAYWQGMKIQTRRATPTPLYIAGGNDTTKSIQQAAGSSFYMMVMLNDRYTGEAVTYAPVSATIKDRSGKVVYRGTMQPTISAFEGPYYGNDVKLPGAGRYTLTLRIDPPHQARHVEYQHVWLKPHTVVEHFAWNGGR
jgi:uncharacterized protein involved in high-affinity Fe2+ transport